MPSRTHIDPRQKTMGFVPMIPTPKKETLR